MALDLHIPPCASAEPHPLHPPPSEQPLRIQLEGPLSAIQKLLPEAAWQTDVEFPPFPQPAGSELARVVFQKLYGRKARPGDFVVRDEYLGWVMHEVPARHIDYYGVTFDHLVPSNATDPEVLQINLIEVTKELGPTANDALLFSVNPGEYEGQTILAVPRCCQNRPGSQDRARVNSSVAERKREADDKKDR